MPRQAPWTVGKRTETPQPGDIVAWPGHVAIYAGNGQVIDASGSKQRVVERSIWGNPSFVTYR